MKIYEGKQHFLENFNFKNFLKNYSILSYEEQRNFIDSYDIQTNPEWLKLRRGKVSASNANKFLSNSLKVSSLMKTKKYQEANSEEQSKILSEIPFDERMGDSCKELAFKILAEKKTKWEDYYSAITDRVSVKRGLIFEQFSSKIYEKETGNKLIDVLFIEKDDLFGFSPDKLIVADDKRIAVEIKNFEPPAYYKAVLDCQKKETIDQVQFQIWAGELDRVDVIYTSFEDNSFKIISHYPDPVIQANLKQRAKDFKKFLDLLSFSLSNNTKEIKC